MRMVNFTLVVISTSLHLSASHVHDWWIAAISVFKSTELINECLMSLG